MNSRMDESRESEFFEANDDALPRRAELAENGGHPVRRRRGLSARIGRGLLLGAALLGIVLLVATLLARDRMPPLTATELEQAELRWQAARLNDYDMEVVVSGRQPSNFQVEVRGGEPVGLTRNGVVPRRGMWDVWTVPGMFDTLQQELDQAANPAGPFGSPSGTQVVERAIFDERYGFPKKYHRIVMGTPLEISWEVVHFQPLNSKSGPPSARQATPEP